MKVYEFSAPFNDELEGIYRSAVTVLSDRAEIREQLEGGGVVQLKWSENKIERPIADFVRVPFPGFVATTKVIVKMAGYAPGAKMIPVTIEGESKSYSLLLPSNVEPGADYADHVFLMKSKYQRVLVTERAKKAWESMSLTGAQFTPVEDFDDDLFSPF